VLGLVKTTLRAIASGLPVATVCRLLAHTRRTEIPVVLCIDVEPDARVFDRGDRHPWRGFEQVMQRIPSLREALSQATQALTGRSIEPTYEPQRPGEVRHPLADIGRARAELGYGPSVGLREGLTKTLEALEPNPWASATG
jgi:hypothetical protein